MRAADTLRRFRRDERGAIVIIVALALVVILGFAALSFDLGRTASTQSELQSYADNLALAAAGELDGDTNARQRARDAAAQIAADYADNGRFNDLTFLTVDLSDYELTFYASIPADDNDPLTDEAENDADARYVAARVAPQGVGLTVTRAFDALLPDGETRDDPEVGAVAVARFTQIACDITPMFFCIPEEPGWRAEDNIGDMIELRSGGSNQGAWTPGNFGFLDPQDAISPGGPCENEPDGGARRDSCYFGAEQPATACFAQRGVDLSPGQQQGIARGLNYRFDIYPQGFHRQRADEPAYRPAPNVIVGEEGTGNSFETDTLPRDDCLDGGTCGRIGDGEISVDKLYEYFARNHGIADGSYSFEMRAGTPSTISREPCAAEDGLECDNPEVLGGFYDQDAYDMITDWLRDIGEQRRAPRYEIYRSELNRAGASDPLLPQGGGDFQNKAETGRAVNAPTWSPNPDRRVLVAAGIDCSPDDGEAINGRNRGVPVEEFVRLFMTEPAGDSSDFRVFTEVIGSASGEGLGQSAGIVRDLVELVR